MRQDQGIVRQMWRRSKRHSALLRGVARYVRKSRVPKGKYYVLHIAKTGGTTLLSLVKELRRTTGRPLPIRKLRHRLTLADVLRQYPEAKVGFIIREPADRFVSAFNSRLRKGVPDHPQEWNARETQIFTQFPSANALAEALSDRDANHRRAARSAFKGIAHLRRGYVYYLKSPAYLERKHAHIYFVTDTQRLDNEIFGFLKPLRVRLDKVEAALKRRHGAPAETGMLSEKALQNLRQFWADEYVLYEYCTTVFCSARAF